MGRHASAERRRSLAGWPIVVGVVVLLLVGAVVAYVRVVNGKKDTGGCSGTTVLPVVVAPGAAPAVIQAAQAFNATKPVARSTCVSVSVTTMTGSTAVQALAGGWLGQRTPAPGLWIADSAADVAALDAAKPALTAGHPTQGLAGSPVVLAVRRAASGAVSWASLASGSGGFLVGIGDPVANRASAAALQSLLRGASGTPAAVSVIDAATVAAAEPVFARLAGGSATVPATTDLALTDLSTGNTTYTAVPVLESDLARFNSTHQTSLTAVYPTGPTAGAQVMPIPLTASWISNAMSDAAAAFNGYLGDAAGTKIFTDAHLRTVGDPVAAVGADLRTPVTTLADASPAVSTAVASAWQAARSTTTSTGTGSTAPTGTAGAGRTGSVGTTATTAATNGANATATGSSTSTGSTTTGTTTSLAPTSRSTAVAPAITFLIDTSASMSTVNNGAQRLTWVKSAVSTVVQKIPGNSYGLWSFAVATNEAIPLGPLDGSISGTPRSSAIVTALNTLSPSGNSYTYGAIRTAFTAAANDAPAGAVHRVLLLTDGSDSTPGVSRDAIKATVAALVGQHPGLTLDIVGLSTSVNEQALAEIASAGGGTFTPVTTLAQLEPTLLTLSS